MELRIHLNGIGIILGIENISDSFQGDYNKVAGKKTEVLQIMEKLNISYHIGFILFHPSVTVSELIANVDYLYGLEKLYRWGVIIEKMRIIPVERLDREYDVEGNVDVAYDYSFQDEEVTKLFNVLCRFANLFDVRDFENICTSTLLLMNLYSNKYEEEPKEFVCFRDEIKKYNSFAIGLFRNLFEVYKELSEDDLFKYIKNKYFKEICSYYYSIQIKRGLVYDFVNQKDDDLPLRVFHGQRRLNGYE